MANYKPITPKVGERYRVLKDTTWHKAGDIVKVVEYNHECSRFYSEKKGTTYYDGQLRTTEYLEPVETEIDLVQDYMGHWKDCTIVSGKAGYFAGELIVGEPIKTSLITKTMNFIKKSLLSKDDKTLIKAGFMDENLNLTTTGKEANEYINFTANKAKLVEMAEEKIAEDKAE